MLFSTATELSNITSGARNSSSPEKTRNSGLNSVADDADFDYDTGNSISEEESELDEEVPEIVVDEVAVAKSPSRGRRSTMNHSLGSAIPFEDSPSILGSSPFEGSISPVDRRKSSVLAQPDLNSGSKIREGAKGRAGPSLGDASASPQPNQAKRMTTEKVSFGSGEMVGDSPNPTSVVTYDDVAMNNNQYEDATDGGYDVDLNVDPGVGVNESEMSSGSNGRRVSFGQEAKKGHSDVATSSSSSSAPKRGRGRPPAKARTPDFDVEHRRNTPDTSRSTKSDISTPGSNDFPRGRQMLDETYDNSDEEALDRTDGVDSDSGEEKDSSGYAHDSLHDDDSYASFLGNKRKSHFPDEDDAYQGTRRSRRATKGQKFAFWKGERPIYDGGRMVGLLTANPTPKKMIGKLMKNGMSKVGKRLMTDSDDDAESAYVTKQDAPIVLPIDVHYLSRDEGDNLLVWDGTTQKTQVMKIVSHKDKFNSTALPITGPRPPGKTGVARAAQHFYIPQITGKSSGWISGSVELPPGAIKDAEGVGDVTQVFFVSDCQDNAIELAIADPSQAEWNHEKAQRQLLKKGDSFFVPSGNVYRLENHSADRTCLIFWTIIRDLVNDNASNIASTE